MTERTDIFGPEYQLLLYSCGYHFGNYGKEELVDFLENTDLDWPQLLEMAEEHQVRPLLYQALKSSGVAKIPGDTLRELEQLCLQITMSNLNLTKEMLRLLALFQQDGMMVVPYKGISLAQTVYGAVGLREFVDIDLFVNAGDIPRIESLMLRAGYEAADELDEEAMAKLLKYGCEYNFNVFENDHRIFHVEPHWRPTRRLMNMEITLDKLQDHLMEGTLFNRPVTLFDPETSLILACVHHGTKDLWWILKQVADVAGFVANKKQPLDWDKLLRLSERFDVRNIVLLGLSLSNRLLNTSLPPAVLAMIDRRPKVRRLTEQIITGQAAFPLAEKKMFSFELTFLMFQLRERLASKLAMILLQFRFHFFDLNERDFAFVRLPKPLYFLYYFIRPLRLLKRLLFERGGLPG